MFENLKAAIAAGITLSGLKGPSAPSSHRAWSCNIEFNGKVVGSAKASRIARVIQLTLDEAVQQEMINALQQRGFALDLTKTPANSIKPDTPANFMRLAIAQIADEMDLAKELKISARTQTLVMLRSNPTKATVFAERFSPTVKAKLIAQYGEDLIEFVNEALEGL